MRKAPPAIPVNKTEAQATGAQVICKELAADVGEVVGATALDRELAMEPGPPPEAWEIPDWAPEAAEVATDSAPDANEVATDSTFEAALVATLPAKLVSVVNAPPAPEVTISKPVTAPDVIVLIIPGTAEVTSPNTEVAPEAMSPPTDVMSPKTEVKPPN